MNTERPVVVVGSGPSGATAALALLEQGIPVTLLESGQSYENGLVVRALGRNLFRKWARNTEQYPYVVSGDPETVWHNTLKVGGLSNFWTGAVPRFSPDDFTEGERLHERYRWPIEYSDLAPYYDYAEELLGVVGERRPIPQLSETGLLVQERKLPPAWRDLAARAERLGQGLMYSPLADGPNFLVRRTGAAFNSFERIVRRLDRFAQFELRLGAHVQRLNWNGALGRVDGVQYVDRQTGQQHRLEASAVVLAAGPMA